MSVDDLVQRYLCQFDLATGTGRALAGFSPLVPEIDDKSDLVECVTALIDFAGGARERLWELRIPHDAAVGREPLVAPELCAAARDGDWRKAVEFGKAVCATIAADLVAASRGAGSPAVSADLSIVDAAAARLSRAARGTAPLSRAAQDSLVADGSRRIPVPDCRQRAYPAAVTLTADPVQVDKAPKTERDLAAFLHSNLQIEFVALDVPMRNLADFGGLPFQFYLDMSRHAHDEMRHIRMLLAELERLGSGIAEFPFEVPDRYEVLATEDLTFRLVVLSRTGEAEALEACNVLIPHLRATGWPGVARMFEHVQCDETRHTWYANRWLRHLVGDDDDAVAAATAAAIERYNELITEVGLRSKPRPPDYLRAYSPLGLDEPGRIHAGFTESEVALMREARRKPFPVSSH